MDVLAAFLLGLIAGFLLCASALGEAKRQQAQAHVGRPGAYETVEVWA